MHSARVVRGENWLLVGDTFEHRGELYTASIWLRADTVEEAKSAYTTLRRQPLIFEEFAEVDVGEVFVSEPLQRPYLCAASSDRRE